MAGRDRTFKCWATLAYGGWVATALRSDSRGAGGIETKVLFLSFVVGLGVGALYGLIRVKSPAPPIVALLGLLGMVLGEQFWIWVESPRNIVKFELRLNGRRLDQWNSFFRPTHRSRVNVVKCSIDSQRVKEIVRLAQGVELRSQVGQIRAILQSD